MQLPKLTFPTHCRTVKVPALCALAILLVTLFLLQWKTDRLMTMPWRSQPRYGSSYIHAGPNATDKAVVMARVATEDVDWAYTELPEWQVAIYHMDDPSQTLHPPVNKGREAMAYLTFLIDHYDNLPNIIAFVHAHERGWPVNWHSSDHAGYSNVEALRNLRTEYVEANGYANLRCTHYPGCPDEVQPLRNDTSREAEMAFADAWMYMFEGNASTVPETVATPCCAQFATTKAKVLERGRGDYVRYRQWLMETELDDATSGRVMEYMWHVMFGKEAVWCPAMWVCMCEQFGRC